MAISVGEFRIEFDSLGGDALGPEGVAAALREYFGLRGSEVRVKELNTAPVKF